MTTVAKEKIVSFHWRLCGGKQLPENSVESQSMTYFHGHCHDEDGRDD